MKPNQQKEHVENKVGEASPEPSQTRQCGVIGCRRVAQAKEEFSLSFEHDGCAMEYHANIPVCKKHEVPQGAWIVRLDD